MTVSKAFSALADGGLVQRRKRAGTVVTRPRFHSMVLAIPDLAEEIRSRGQSYAFALLRRTSRSANPDIVSEAALFGSDKLFAINGIHLADGIPIALESRLVSARAVPAFGNAGFGSDAPGSWLLREVPWTEAETRISAVAATRAEAAALGVSEGTACLAVERNTWRGTEGITWVRQLFLGDAYDLVAKFGPFATREK